MAVPRYRFADFVLSPRRRVLARGGRDQLLIPRYFDLLVLLVERRHEAVHRREIFDRVWNDVVVSDSALSQAVRTLRRALDDDSQEPRFIRTVSRHGYQFVYPDVTEEDDDASWPGDTSAATVAVAVTVESGPVAAVSREDHTVRAVPAGASLVARGATGAGIAGALAGILGGLVLVAAPGSAAPLPSVIVLSIIGAACGAIGAAGVTGGASAASMLLPTRPAAALAAGAAAGGTLVGALAQALARISLSALVGIHVPVGGALEGLVIGGAAGAALAAAAGGNGVLALVRAPRARLAALTAAACGLAALGLTLAGYPLVGGTIHAIAEASRGSQVALTPLGRLMGEADFGLLARSVIGAGEGTLFGLGLAQGLTHRMRE